MHAVSQVISCKSIQSLWAEQCIGTSNSRSQLIKLAGRQNKTITFQMKVPGIYQSCYAYQGMQAPSANLEDSTTTGAGCVVPHGHVVGHHLGTSGNVDSTAVLGCVAQHLSVGEGQLGDVVGGHTASLCPLVHVAAGVVHVQGRSICITQTVAFEGSVWLKALRAQAFGFRRLGWKLKATHEVQALSCSCLRSCR